jgi:hypothetical protein
VDQRADRAVAQQIFKLFTSWSAPANSMQILVSMKRALAGYLLAAAIFIRWEFSWVSLTIYRLFEVIVEMLHRCHRRW